MESTDVINDVFIMLSDINAFSVDIFELSKYIKTEEKNRKKPVSKSSGWQRKLCSQVYYNELKADVRINKVQRYLMIFAIIKWIKIEIFMMLR